MTNTRPDASNTKSNTTDGFVKVVAILAAAMVLIVWLLTADAGIAKVTKDGVTITTNQPHQVTPAAREKTSR